MEIKIISEWKKLPKKAVGENKPVRRNCKRVMCIVEEDGVLVTRHKDIPA